jgi:hypothetical protein
MAWRAFGFCAASPSGGRAPPDLENTEEDGLASPVKPRLFLLTAVAALAAASFLRSEPVTSAGDQIVKTLDSMDVEHNWLVGHGIDWKTGKDVADADQHASHCSAFAAAVCERFGVYLLRPPEHSQIYLANAQQDWLETKGPALGWKPVGSAIEAQKLANQGWIVLVTFKNPNPKKAGHIAVVRPADLAPEAIQKDGPEETQSGKYNYNATVVREGFKVHKGAFDSGALRYFAHAAK